MIALGAASLEESPTPAPVEPEPDQEAPKSIPPMQDEATISCSGMRLNMKMLNRCCSKMSLTPPRSKKAAS